MFVTTSDGARIYYEDHGRGRPIVLVHGWACSGRFWQRNVPALAEDFRVVTVTLGATATRRSRLPAIRCRSTPRTCGR